MGQLNFSSLSCMYNTNVHSIKDKNLVFAIAIAGHDRPSCELQDPLRFSKAYYRSGSRGLARLHVCFQYGELYPSLDDWYDYKYSKPIVDSFLHSFRSNIHQVARGSKTQFLLLLHVFLG